MKWIQTGRQIGQAVKNVQRLRQMIAVFVKHGFVDVVDRMNLNKFLPGRLKAYAIAQADKTIAERLRLAFEELGPTFIKLGQLLSTRSDLLPHSFIEEFIQLQDHVQPLSFDIIQAVIEKELQQSLQEAYLSFEEIPLAAASISQVHGAILHTGEKVVVKVQRPEIQKIIETDISLLIFLSGLLEKYIPETRMMGPKTIVNEFFRTLSYELDFIVEANNITKITENMASFSEIVIPHVYKTLSTHKILTLERFEGIPVNHLQALDDAKIDKKKIVQLGAQAFFKGVMIDGLFHGDLHGGNLFILPDNRLGIIDFGIVGRLSQKSRDQLATMVIALLTEDYETLCYEYAELSVAGAAIDFDRFQREIRNTLSPYLGLSLSEFNMGKILIEATQIATRFQMTIPGDWMMVFKAILTLEGMGRKLDPSFDFLAMGQVFMKDLLKNRYSLQRMSKDFFWVLRDLASLLKVLPRQIRWMFRKLNRNDFAFEIKSPDLQKLTEQVDRSFRRLSLGLVSVGLLIASSLALLSSNHELAWNEPSFAGFYFILGCFFLVGFVFKNLF